MALSSPSRRQRQDDRGAGEDEDHSRHVCPKRNDEADSRTECLSEFVASVIADLDVHIIDTWETVRVGCRLTDSARSVPESPQFMDDSSGASCDQANEGDRLPYKRVQR